ncbi:MAG: 30S ribosomal protein S4 [Patescibacteria group bacterium]
MIVGPKYKIGKRLGAGVFEKCQTQKFALSEARSGKSKRRRGARSDYAKQFLEKQKVRYTYGIMEKQFKNYIIKANDVKNIKPVDYLYQMLEQRLDNVVYRMGLASTRRLARQIVSHGHITLNGTRVTIPSMNVKIGDLVKIREGSKKSVLFANLEERLKEHATPNWVLFDPKKGEGTIKESPPYQRTGLHFDLSPVLEFYSR